MINLALKAKCIELFGTEIEAARRAGLHLPRLSEIIHRHRKPNAQDVEKLAKIFGDDEVRRLL